MKKDLEEIYHLFEGKLVGGKVMKQHVCEVLALTEEPIISYITSNCWFLGSTNDAWAYTLTGNDLKDQHLVILSDELFTQSPVQIRYTIAHEIGHVILKHRNSILERQSKSEIRQQEKEADLFAKRCVKTYTSTY